MRTFAALVVAALVVHAAPPAGACPAPPPMVDTLTLVTAPGATLPADGALLVQRGRTMDRTGARAGAAWTVRHADGTPVAVTVEVLGGGLERWVLPPRALGPLRIVDGAGAEVGSVERTATAGPRLAVPRPRRVTSTIDARASRGFPGIPGGTTTLTLARPAPAAARYLVVELAGAAGYAQAAHPVTAGQRQFATTTYPSKGCGGGPGVAPLIVGQRIALTWVDDLGRRSPAARATVGRGRAP